MILSHMASSCIDMSPYRAIGTHFRFILMIAVKIVELVLDQIGVLDQVLDQIHILDQVLVLDQVRHQDLVQDLDLVQNLMGRRTDGWAERRRTDGRADGQTGRADRWVEGRADGHAGQRASGRVGKLPLESLVFKCQLP